MKKIGIIGINDNHLDYIYTLVKILKTDDSQIILFSSKYICSELSKTNDCKKNIYFFTKDTKESTSRFLKKNKAVLNQLDLLVCDEFFGLSLKNEWRLPFVLNLKCKQILTLHNVNFWLKPKLSLQVKLFANVLFRKILLRKFDGISVFSNSMKEYVFEQTNYKGLVYLTPFSFYSNEFGNELNGLENTTITITIPGTINKARRDYEIILDIYKKIFKKKFSIKLVLLGEPIGEYGIMIINRCKEMNNDGCNIEYFEKFIPKHLFEEKIRESSLLLADIPTKYCVKGKEEIYGLTKETGITWLAVKFAKPIILPKSFNNIIELNKSIINYDNVNDIENILKNLNYKIIKELNDQALVNSQKFTIDKIRKDSKLIS